MSVRRVIWPVLSAGLLLSSCGGGKQIEISYIGAMSDDDAEWGLLAPDGKMLFSDEFDEAPSSAFNGYFVANEGAGYSVYKATKNPKPVKGLTGLSDAGFYSEGLIPVVRNGERIEMVDGEGKKCFTLDPVDGFEVARVNGFFNGGVAQIMLENDMVGAIDKEGNVVIKPEWTSMYWFSEGVTFATKDDASGKQRTYLIDNRGNELCKLASSLTPMNYYFEHDISPVYKGSEDDRMMGFINRKGQFAKVSPAPKSVSEWNKDYFTYSEDDEKWGLMTMRGEVLIKPKFSSLYMLSGNRLLARKGDRCMIINSAGDEVERFDGTVEFLYPGLVDAFTTKFSLVYHDEDGDYYLMDEDGKYDPKRPLDRVTTFTPSTIISTGVSLAVDSCAVAE